MYLHKYYSGSPYNGAVIQVKPPITATRLAVIGDTVVGNGPVSYTGAPYNGYFGRYRKQHRYEK